MPNEYQARIDAINVTLQMLGPRDFSLETFLETATQVYEFLTDADVHEV